MRYKLTLEYDGGPFSGFQRQANGPSIQEKLEAALARIAGEAVRIVGAGRTDAGVHALGQVVHCDLDRAIAPARLAEAVNFHLRPCPIAVLAAEAAGEGFHARFSARGRRYLYRIVNRRAPLALERGRAWGIARPLDAPRMDEAAKALLGTHDFTTFRAAGCQARSPVKTLGRLEVARSEEHITILAEAPSFLHHQVRSIVGTLKKIGEGSWPVEALASALAARDRKACGPVAPPHGLYLAEVLYGPPSGQGRDEEGDEEGEQIVEDDEPERGEDADAERRPREEPHIDNRQ